MRWMKNVSLAMLGGMMTLTGLAGGTWLIIHRGLAARAGDGPPTVLDLLSIAVLITLVVVGFGLLVVTGPQITDDSDHPRLDD
jgi:hypothetical protein